MSEFNWRKEFREAALNQNLWLVDKALQRAASILPVTRNNQHHLARKFGALVRLGMQTHATILDNYDRNDIYLPAAVDKLRASLSPIEVVHGFVGAESGPRERFNRVVDEVTFYLARRKISRLVTPLNSDERDHNLSLIAFSQKLSPYRRDGEREFTLEQAAQTARLRLSQQPEEFTGLPRYRPIARYTNFGW